MKKSYLIIPSLSIISLSSPLATASEPTQEPIAPQTISSEEIILDAPPPAYSAPETFSPDSFSPASAYTAHNSKKEHNTAISEQVAPTSKSNPLPSDDPFTPANTFTGSKTIRTHFPNGIAAIVESRIITVDEVQRKVIPFLQQIRREVTDEKEFLARVDETASEVLNRMIDDMILVNSFTSNKKLKLPQAYLDLQYNKALEEQFNGDRSLYNEYLAAQGISDRQFRERQKEEVIISFVRMEMRKSQSEISPDKIQKYYDSNPNLFQQEAAVHLQQIMLTPPAEADEDSIKTCLESKASPIIKKLKDGATFTDVAKEFSEDDMKSSGGDWGWINRNDINPELAKVAFSLEKDSFSDPVILNDHAFILYVKDFKEKGLIPLENVRDNIEKIIVNDLATKAQEAQVQKLREKAHIKIFI